MTVGKLPNGHLTKGVIVIIIIWSIGVWRSLVSRLVRVQEASGSNPDTPTRIPVTTFVVAGFFIRRNPHTKRYAF